MPVQRMVSSMIVLLIVFAFSVQADPPQARADDHTFVVRFQKQLVDPNDDPQVWVGNGRIGGRHVDVRTELPVSGITPVSPTVIGISDFVFEIVDTDSGSVLHTAQLEGKIRIDTGQIRMHGISSNGCRVALKARTRDGLLTVSGTAVFKSN